MNGRKRKGGARPLSEKKNVPAWTMIQAGTLTGRTGQPNRAALLWKKPISWRGISKAMR